jgi:hypothetical protein
MKPQPNPTTQARVDATDTAARAKAKAEAAELTLARYHAQATALGVQSIRFEIEHDGIVVILRGNVDGRNVSVETLCPNDKPFVVFAVAALASFESGMSTKTIPLTPNTPPDVPLPEPVTPQHVLDAIEADGKARAAEIAKRAAHSQHGDIRKPAPAGAGKRKPLSLPLCKQCEAQPVYQPNAEFCGSACARRWHTDNAGKVAKASR